MPRYSRMAESKRVSRVISVALSPSMTDMQDYCGSLLRITDDDRLKCYPWVLAENETSLADSIIKALDSAFDASLVLQLSKSGVNLLDTVNQLIILADLTDKSTPAKLTECFDAIRKTIYFSGHHGQAPFISLVLLLRRANYDNSSKEKQPTEIDGAGQKSYLIPLQETLDQVNDIISNEPLLTKLFLTDVRNKERIILRELSDQKTLISHLWYYLVVNAVIEQVPKNFSHWITSLNTAEGYVSSLGACSLILPVDQILDLIAVRKGAELIKDVLVEEKPGERHKYYFHNYLLENSLLDPKQLHSAMKGNTENNVIDLLEYLSFPEGKITDSYSLYLTELNDKIPEAIQYNRFVIDKVKTAFVQKCSQSLSDHVDSIVSQEPGGIVEAIRFTDMIKEHLKELGTNVEIIAEKNTFDAQKLIDNLKFTLNTRPQPEAIIIRTAICLVALLCFVTVLNLPLFKFLMGFGASFIACTLLGFFVLHSSKQELINLCKEAEAGIRYKWLNLMKQEVEQAAEEFATGLFEKVEKINSELKDSLARTKDIIKYYNEEYMPDLAEERTMQMYMLKAREEMLEYEDKCKFDLNSASNKYRKQVDLSLAWQRLSKSQGIEPDSYEQSIFQKAAIELLPGMQKILDLKTSEWLRLQDDKAKNYVKTMALAAFPFISPDPNEVADEWSVKSLFEAEDDRSTAQMLKLFQEHFEDVKLIAPENRSRLTFFGIADGISFKSFKDWIG